MGACMADDGEDKIEKGEVVDEREALDITCRMIYCEVVMEGGRNVPQNLSR
jgi:hypothetical protein